MAYSPKQLKYAANACRFVALFCVAVIVYSYFQGATANDQFGWVLALIVTGLLWLHYRRLLRKTQPKPDAAS